MSAWIQSPIEGLTGYDEGEDEEYWDYLYEEEAAHEEGWEDDCGSR